jgi:hypothetical protein
VQDRENSLFDDVIFGRNVAKLSDVGDKHVKTDTDLPTLMDQEGVKIAELLKTECSTGTT